MNHLLALTAHALDVGALTPFLWGFEEREKLMSFYEKVSGARMHAAFFRPGGVQQDLPLNLLFDIYDFISSFPYRLLEFEELLHPNRIWKQRLLNTGIISEQAAISYGASGVLLRSTGVTWDLRKAMPYEGYLNIGFEVPFGSNGDSFDRYLLRMEELFQSNHIML